MDTIFLVIIGIIVGLVLFACLICCLIKCLKQQNGPEINSAPKQSSIRIDGPPATAVIQVEPEIRENVKPSIESDDDSQSDDDFDEEEEQQYVEKRVKVQHIPQQKQRHQSPAQAARRYQIREKIFSLGDDFVIKDDGGRHVFFVRSKLLSFGDQHVLEDMAGNGLLKIRQEVWNWNKTYKILSARTNQDMATIKKKFTFFTTEFLIQSVYGHYELNGNILAHSFTLAKSGRIVATVNKKFFALSDTYGVQVAGGEDHAFILALVIVLDQAVHDKK